MAQRVPWVLLSLHGGALVDRSSLRRVIPLTEVVRATALVILTLLILTGKAGMPALYAVAFVIGTGDTLVSTGLHTAIPHMVPDAALDKANGRIQLTQVSGDYFIGPALGGLLFAVIAWLPFALDALSYGIAAGILAVVLPARPPKDRTSRINADIAEGLRWFARSRVLRLLAFVIAGFAFFQATVFSLLVLLTTDQLGLSDVGFGLFLTVGAGGNILGAFAAERLPTNRIDYVVIGAGTVAAATYVVMGLTTSFWVAGVAFFIEGIVLAVANIVTMSLRQRLIPREMLGRVGAAFRMCLFGMMPLGALFGGVIADLTTVGTLTWLAGVGQLLAVGVVAPGLIRVLGPDVGQAATQSEHTDLN